jgi:hypothetical protein
MKNTLKLMRKYDPDIPDVSDRLKKRLDVDEGFFGGIYGKATCEGESCIEKLKTENVQLDLTYTAKAFSCLLERLKSNKQGNEFNEKSKKNYLFWNTLNSRDFSAILKSLDYTELPKEFHQFFDGSIPLDVEPVWCCDEHKSISPFSSYLLM